MDAVALPFSMAFATAIAALMGIEYAWVAGVAELPNEYPPPLELAAVSMPTTLPVSVTSGPPESPGWMGAFVSMSPESFSEPERFSSLCAVIDWFFATTVPAT